MVVVGRFCCSVGFFERTFRSFVRSSSPRSSSTCDERKRFAGGAMANVVSLVDANDDESQISAAVEMAVNSLHKGNIIALPTDTIYGIAGLAQNSTAVQKLYEVKGRNMTKPVSISVGDVKDVYKWGKVTISDALLNKLLPGPVTVVFERLAALNPVLNPGTTLVGIRVPDHGFVREVCRLCSEPLALTSANVSSQESTLAVEEFEHLWSQLDLVFDGGHLGSAPLSKKGSTVVDLSKKNVYTIIREGSAFNSTVSILNRYGLREDQKT